MSYPKSELQPFIPIEAFQMKETDFPTRVLKLGFVNLGDDNRPKNNKRYDIISASDGAMESIEYPDTLYKRLDLNLYAFYIDDLPDFTKKNEGLLKISVNTRNPQNIQATDNDATTATNFQAEDGSYAPTFLSRGVFRNVLFENMINLKFDLYELDTDAGEYFNKVKQVVNDVPEIKNLDVLKGIPYLNLASSLFESIINTFGKNPDDYLWGEIPTLEIDPTIGGAFLRSGIYVLFEEINSHKEKIGFSHLEYLNERVVLKKETKRQGLSNHLIFGIRLKKYEEKLFT